ncbi:MAG: ATPase, partial [Anaerotignum sp.]|nr:ATPase [Anaerotignum sp.]
MDWWNMQISQAERILKTDRKTGLPEGEASRRLTIDGKNRLIRENGRKTFFRRLFAQFNDFMILLLMGAAAASLAVSRWNGEENFLDVAIIIAIVVLNAILGVLQESRAEQALEALKELSAPRARVLRSGKEKEIPGEDVVTGDVL